MSAFREMVLVRLLIVGAVLAGLAGCGGGSGSTTSTTSALQLSATSLSFGNVTVGTKSSAQTIVFTAAGASLTYSGISVSGANASAFSASSTCPANVALSASCTIVVIFTPTAAGPQVATLTVADSALGSPQAIALSGTGVAALPIVSLSPTSILFASQAVGSAVTSQTVIVTNNGTAALNIAGVTQSATTASFTLGGSCTAGAVVAIGQTCTIVVGFSPTQTGTLSSTITLADNAANAPQTIAVAGNGTNPAAPSVDCSTSGTNGGVCPAIAFQGDTIASGGFHGYADPSLRKDPNSSNLYVAYSWAHVLPDGTDNVDLHLSHSVDGGNTFNYDGPIYQHSAANEVMFGASNYYVSTETIDLLPIQQGVTTLWVQAHQEYLTAPTTSIYANIYSTSIISISAVSLTNPSSSGAPAALYQGFSTAGEARLGGTGEGSTRGVTQNLASLSTATAKCDYFGQPALTYVAGTNGAVGTLYLMLECTENPGSLDSHELSHFLYSTTPTGSNASLWTWAYVGELATPAQAAALGVSEGTSYTFFTEPQLVQTAAGLAVVMTPGVFNTSASAQQPVIQYGCRVVPVTSIAGASLATTGGVPTVIAKVTENDLYTGANEGPAACTYDPASATGIMIGRKLENDPTLGFIITQQASKLKP